MTDSADYVAPEVGSRSYCANCGAPVVFASIDGWIHEDGGPDPVPCDWVPVAEPGPNGHE